MAVYLIEAEWCIYASVNEAIIGPNNGLLPGWRQAIIWTNAGMLLIGHLRTNFSEIISRIFTFSFQENAFQNAVIKLAAILFRPQCVKLLTFVGW